MPRPSSSIFAKTRRRTNGCVSWSAATAAGFPQLYFLDPDRNISEISGAPQYPKNFPGGQVRKGLFTEKRQCEVRPVPAAQWNAGGWHNRLYTQRLFRHAFEDSAPGCGHYGENDTPWDHSQRDP